MTLGWTILYILHNKNVQKQIHNELDALNHRSDDLVTMVDKIRLPYLCATINVLFLQKLI